MEFTTVRGDREGEVGESRLGLYNGKGADEGGVRKRERAF
jgi:hypothetical protein